MLSTRPRRHRSSVDELISSVPLFEACTRAEIQTIRRLGDVVTVEPGTVLAGEAELHSRFYAVLSGTVSVHRYGRDERPLEPGDTYGALETLRRLRMPGTLVASERSEVLIVGPREFAGLVDEVPGVARRLLLAHVPQRALTVVGPRTAVAPATAMRGSA